MTSDRLVDWAPPDDAPEAPHDLVIAVHMALGHWGGEWWCGRTHAQVDDVHIPDGRDDCYWFARGLAAALTAIGWDLTADESPPADRT